MPAEHPPPVGRRPRIMAACLVLTALSACFPEAEQVSSDLSCDEALGSTYTGPDEDVSAETVVLVDVSASMWRDSGEFPDFSDDVSELAVDENVFGQGGERLLSVARFSGGESTPEYLLDRTRIAEAVGTADGQQHEDLGRVRDCLGERLADLPRPSAASDGSDVLGAIASGAGKLTGSTKAPDPDTVRRLHVFTDGLVNTGCLDLNRYFDEGLGRDEIVADCASSGEEPKEGLDGVNVTVFLQNSPEHGFDRTQRGTVQDVWTEVCGIYGAGECATSPGEERAPTETVDADPPEVADTEVMVPKADLADRSELELPSQLLFSFDSAKLRPSANDLLDEAVDAGGGGFEQSVAVTGHTDSKGSAEYNKKLSQRRAEAVADYLESLGFADITVEGKGESDLACADDYKDGELADAECAQDNRRVVIGFTD
ncbi:outer membrane protein OmpA-like peptidoglycan-associated protein [Lipingzhangella halophila]|uniref:Outer membrane protein OmpA-like peptidoglycan-associated protein n=1 Tax=Lipingzhangella halophila TaxID=1783352 RepID=A0A7W7RNE2_9ACTN|nr:OmpA family protein [Lipingzhangella halophila]MBB4935223.1 outer membrane protein OmpA-like peptidoglycan-associated protein [Lipingzhangella halophila]